VLRDAYGLDPAGRAACLVEVAGMEVRQAAAVSVDAHPGDPGAQGLWDDGQFTEATARSLDWLAAHREHLQATLA